MLLCPYNILDEAFSGCYALMASLAKFFQAAILMMSLMKCFQATILISDTHDEVFSGRYPLIISLTMYFQATILKMSFTDKVRFSGQHDVLDEVFSLTKCFQAAILMMSLKCFQAEAMVSWQAGVAVVSSCAYTTAAFSFS